jgi:four helix bundle protein
MIRSYRDLRVWARAVELASCVYALTRGFPGHERFGLTSQMRRAAVSVPANIAEGHGRHTRGEFLNHLSIANGSLMELETHVELARMLGYLDASSSQELLRIAGSVSRMLTRLTQQLRVVPPVRARPGPSP